MYMSGGWRHCGNWEHVDPPVRRPGGDSWSLKLIRVKDVKSKEYVMCLAKEWSLPELPIWNGKVGLEMGARESDWGCFMRGSPMPS